jgi:hypothetical protein
MKEWGCNVVRIEIASWAIYNKVINNPDFFLILDNMIDWAENNEIYVVLAGFFLSGQNRPDGNQDQDLSVWTESDWITWKNHWEMLAIRYSGKSHILYDLMNEPYNLNWSIQQTRFRECIDTIRAINSDVIIIVESSSESDWHKHSLKFEQSYPIDRANIVFSLHAYFQEEPKGSNNFILRWDLGGSKTDIRTYLDSLGAKWLLDTNKAVWIGEFNTELDSFPNGETYLRNFYEVLNEDDYVGWASHWWNDGGKFKLLASWNGEPTVLGAILQEYLK